MDIDIIFESETGNTKLIAESIKETCERENHTVQFKTAKEALEIDEQNDGTDCYFLGSWTHKGDMSDLLKLVAKKMHRKNIALFGTAGTSESEEYYDRLKERFSSAIPEDNKIIGSFFAQGKMPDGIRDKYISLFKEHPENEKLKDNIKNYDSAKSHPNQNDLNSAKVFAKEIIMKVSNSDKDS